MTDDHYSDSVDATPGLGTLSQLPGDPPEMRPPMGRSGLPDSEFEGEASDHRPPWERPVDDGSEPPVSVEVVFDAGLDGGRRRPTEVTADRLRSHLGSYEDQLTRREVEALRLVAHALDEIGAGRR